MSKAENPVSIDVSQAMIRKWQSVVDVLAELLSVPAALIMKAEYPYIEVFTASHTPGNPYQPGEREHLAGLYCEKVIRSNHQLLIPNALKDEDWMNNPDIKLGMIAYFGFPLAWPSGDIFGTICVLDTKENQFDRPSEKALRLFKDLVESHLALFYSNHQLNLRTEELETALSEVETLQRILPICAKCKKIRNDQGYWDVVEDYLRKTSDLRFTHSLCPNCTQSLLDAQQIIDRKHRPDKNTT
jgi:hypothetical protein